MIDTIYRTKKINGINFELEFFTEDTYKSSDPFEPDIIGYTIIENIIIDGFPDIDIPDSVYQDIMLCEDDLTQEFIEDERNNF